MHSKQLKHFKPLNPDRSREREGKSDRERCDEEGGAVAEPRESLSQWEMTNAICPEHSACVNPRRVPAGPHPTLRPLHHPPPIRQTTLSASTGRVDQSRRSSGLRMHFHSVYGEGSVRSPPTETVLVDQQWNMLAVRIFSATFSLQNIFDHLSSLCLQYEIMESLFLLVF